LANYPSLTGNASVLPPNYLRSMRQTIDDFMIKNRTSVGVIDELLNWTVQREELFKRMYDFGLFRARISGSRSSGLAAFHESLGAAKEGANSYTNLVYHAENIQDSMDRIRDLLCTGNSGQEYVIVYRILKTKEKIETDRLEEVTIS